MPQILFGYTRSTTAVATILPREDWLKDGLALHKIILQGDRVATILPREDWLKEICG